MHWPQRPRFGRFSSLILRCRVYASVNIMSSQLSVTQSPKIFYPLFPSSSAVIPLFPVFSLWPISFLHSNFSKRPYVRITPSTGTSAAFSSPPSTAMTESNHLSRHVSFPRVPNQADPSRHGLQKLWHSNQASLLWHGSLPSTMPNYPSRYSQHLSAITKSFSMCVRKSE